MKLCLVQSKEGLNRLIGQAKSSPIRDQTHSESYAQWSRSATLPPRNSNADRQIGMRLDKGKSVQGKPNTLVLKPQVNVEAEDSTLKELAAKNSHKVVRGRRTSMSPKSATLGKLDNLHRKAG